MKKLKFILIISLIGLFGQVKGQKDEYIPLAVEGAQWLILQNYEETPYDDHYFGYKIKGDTLINDTAYKKVYKREFESVNEDYSWPYEIIDEFIFGAIRDDIAERKVYTRKFINNGGLCPSNKDYLMFDFSLEIGNDPNQTMCLFYGSDHAVINIFYGTYDDYNTKYFEFNSCYSNLLEGIGSYNGLYEDMECHEVLNTLKVYCIGNEQECLGEFIVSVPEQKQRQNNILLSPNPAINVINIKYPQHLLINKIIITDITGRTIKQIYNNLISEIIISEFKKGIYFINFYEKNLIINTQKIVKI